jgi:hypothetical protein
MKFVLCSVCKQNRAVAVVACGFEPPLLETWALCEKCFGNFDPSYTPRQPQQAADLQAEARKWSEPEEHWTVELNPE